MFIEPILQQSHVLAKTGRVARSEGRAAIASRHATAMPFVTNFCSELTGDVLDACKSIPESCVSLNAPPFNQIVGEPELFIRIKKVIQEASLGTHRFFVLGPGRGTTATHESAKARPPPPLTAALTS